MPRKHARAKNIGHLTCPTCRRVAPVRRKTPRGHTVADGPYYYQCGNCGMGNVTNPGGQAWLLKNATLWGAAGCPAEMPAWIRDDRAYPPKEEQDSAAVLRGDDDAEEPRRQVEEPKAEPQPEPVTPPAAPAKEPEAKPEAPQEGLTLWI